MSEGRKGSSIPFCLLCVLVFVVTAFTLLLVVYGDSWLVPWHDEVVIGRLAQNIAEGKGFCNDLLDDLLKGANERTYWQMPIYPFVLSLWGKIFGFDLNSLRWFSRIWGVIAVLLSFALALRLRLPAAAAVLTVLWGTTDLSFQFASNFVRPEILTCAFLLISVLLLTFEPMTSGRSLLIGLTTTLAIFSHPISLPCWFVFGAILVKRNGWRSGVTFALPLLFGTGAWLAYGIQDWGIFVEQMKSHLAHKSYPIAHRLAFLLGTTFWGIQHYLGIPLNALPWIAVILASIWINYREQRWFLPRWFLLFVTVLYATVALGAEAWYPASFVPFGYLLLAAIGWCIWTKAQIKVVKVLLLAFAFGWWSYQAKVVSDHVFALAKIRNQVTDFVSELVGALPKNSVVLIGSFSPDPTFALMKLRPDLRIYQLMPSPMINPSALMRLREHLTHLLVLEDATKEPLLSGQHLKSWHFDFGGLTQRRHKGVTIVLLKVLDNSSQSPKPKQSGQEGKKSGR